MEADLTAGTEDFPVVPTTVLHGISGGSGWRQEFSDMKNTCLESLDSGCTPGQSSKDHYHEVSNSLRMHSIECVGSYSSCTSKPLHCSDGDACSAQADSRIQWTEVLKLVSTCAISDFLETNEVIACLFLNTETCDLLDTCRYVPQDHWIFTSFSEKVNLEEIIRNRKGSLTVVQRRQRWQDFATALAMSRTIRARVIRLGADFLTRDPLSHLRISPSFPYRVAREFAERRSRLSEEEREAQSQPFGVLTERRVFTPSSDSEDDW